MCLVSRTGYASPAFLFARRSFRGSLLGLLLLLTMKTLVCLNYSDAQKAINRIVEKATEMRQEVAVAVTDSHGELIAFARMDGVPLPSIQIAINKAWTAARTRKPTQEIGEKVRHPERGHDISYYGDPRFVGWGGGLPVVQDQQVVGAVSVSGLSSTEDAKLAKLGADAIHSSELP
jgi:glc operon protein GlcG